MESKTSLPLVLRPSQLVGPIVAQADAPILPGGTWYLADLADKNVVTGFEYSFPAGALSQAAYLTADMLLDGKFLTVFELNLQEGPQGRKATLAFGLLNQCQARARIPLSFADQNRRHLGREGAWLNVRVTGQKIDLAKVDRMNLLVLRRGDARPRFCLTAFAASSQAPPRLADPLLPRGALLDEMGQSTLHDWPAKSRSAQEVSDRLHRQLAEAPSRRWPAAFSRWGGWKEKRFDATGFFRTQKTPQRWWLVDPDGFAFWSAGLDCVAIHIESAYEGLEKALSFLPAEDGPCRQAFRAGFTSNKVLDYLAVNLIRAFGPGQWYEKWAAIALGELRGMGFNTVANWSDWKAASVASLPYVRDMRSRFSRTRLLFRDFPDVFEPSFAEEAAGFAEALKETALDPAMIGYFMMNEPQWGFADFCPAEGMLLTAPACKARGELSKFLRGRYADDDALAAAWATDATFQRVAEGPWAGPFSQQARGDLEAFTSVMVGRYWRTLAAACRKADPNHMNLGVRYHRAPPAWAVEGMECFDVFSMNCYRDRLPVELIAPVADRLGRPVLIGEYHFGALDVGLPAAGLRLVGSQADRARAFRVYQEDACTQSWCVGAHYFTLYDQSALGRHDGEHYQIGFLDVCNRPYEPMAQAARASNERMYRVADGQLAPFNDAPQYL